MFDGSLTEVCPDGGREEREREREEEDEEEEKEKAGRRKGDG